MDTKTTVVTGGTALVGRDLRRLEAATLVLQGTEIIAVGAEGTVETPAGAEVVDASGLTLMPGFIDCHVHIAFADPHRVVFNGVTTVRDLGWSPEEIWPLVDKSISPGFRGPRIVAAGQMLTVAGGYPTRAGWAPSGVGRVVGDGNAAAVVADQARRGAVIIKVALNAEAGPTIPEPLLRDVVAASHEKGLNVTAHVTGLGELRKAIDVGVDELAHMLMSEERIPQEMIREMVAAEMVVVPTLAVRFGADQEIAIDNLARFIHAGGRVVYGTDLGNAGPEPGIDPREIEALHRGGLSGRAIIRAATVDAADCLRLHRTGILATGMDADIVAVSGDPLRNPNNILDVRMVWRDGRRIR
jgi:imidazolonepropionase-like amidohydrolase